MREDPPGPCPPNTQPRPGEREPAEPPHSLHLLTSARGFSTPTGAILSQSWPVSPDVLAQMRLHGPYERELLTELRR
jgi:hypothetical protein